MGFIQRKLWASATNPPSNAAPLRNGKFTPRCTGAIFSTFPLFPFQMPHCWSVLTCPSADVTRGVSGFPPEGGIMLWQSGAAGGAATSQAACTGTRQIISVTTESCDTAECIRHFFFTWCKRLSHTCLKVTSVPLHLMLLIRGESWGILLWLITLSIPLSLFFPSIFNFMFCLPAALAH